MLQHYVQHFVERPRGGGGLCPNFFYAAVPLRDLEPHPLIRHASTKTLILFYGKFKKKCLKMYDSVDLRKILCLKLEKHAFFRGETSIFTKKGPFCKALLGPKGDPFVRQNFKCGPLCIFCQTMPVKWHIRVCHV